MRAKRRQNGFTLIETLVAVALLGFIGVGLMGGLFTSYRSLNVNQEKVIAENLAKSQIREHI